MASVVKRPAPIPRWFWFASMLGCTPGFRRSRCKKLLKVTMSRIKLLRGKREVQVRQLRRDVAQLLQLGQEENAESRVDRLWKEQSLLSAYIKTGEYCQLVKANLSNIALPRECPMDLKEPIASLCFAASCCADLPELQEIRDIMVAKYGKDSLLSAHELLPGKHVNKMFLEAFATKDQSELSRKVLLKGIIKEYNVVQPRKPKYPPNQNNLQKVPSSTVPACTNTQKQQSSDANISYSDCHQPHSLLASKKEEKHQVTRPVDSVANKAMHTGENGEHLLHVEAKKPGQHKQGPKYERGQLELGTTENSYEMLLTAPSYEKPGRGRSRQKEHKGNTGADEVGEGDQHLSSKQKSNNHSFEPESAVLHGLHGYHERPVPRDVEIKSNPKGIGKMPKEKSRSHIEVKDTSRGQRENGTAHPLKSFHGRIQGEENPTYVENENGVLIGRQQRHCDEALSQGFGANGMQQEMDLHYDEQYHEERVIQQDSDRAQLEREMPDSDYIYVKTSKGHSKIKELSSLATESNNYMQQDSSFHDRRRQIFHEEPRSGGTGTAHDYATQQPSWRESGPLPEYRDAQKVQRERKHSSKISLHDPLQIEASLGPFPDADSSQKMRKRHVKKHHREDVQKEPATDVSKLLPDEAENVSLSLPKCYMGNEFQSTEAARQGTKSLHKVENHGTEAGARSKKVYGDNREEHAVGCQNDEGHVPHDASIPAMQSRSRRTKRPARRFLYGNLINEESMQETLAEGNVHVKASFAGYHGEGSSTFRNESTQRERRHFSELTDRRERGYNSEVKSYGVHQVNSAKDEPRQPEKLDDHKEAHDVHRVTSAKEEQRQPKNLDTNKDAQAVNECSQLEKGSPVPSRFSKPPDRPPPPVPPYRVSSLPSRKPLNGPPVLPQRSVTLETSQIRASQEPHVHPNLPDYEDLVASFAALRHKPPKPSSSM